MSTSPEAKQAAVEWAKTKSAFGNQGREEFVFAQGYDAATAKLREELELARGLLEEQRSYESIRNTELIQQLVREQLAHQQPSGNAAIREALEEAAKTVEFEHSHGTNGIGIAAAIRHLATHPKWRDQQPNSTNEPLFGEHIKEAVGAIKPLFTPEVEKIARESVIKLQDSCIQIDPRIAITIMRESLAQARAPLVAALRKVRRGLASAPTSLGFKCEVDIIDSALTDTEEKLK